MNEPTLNLLETVYRLVDLLLHAHDLNRDEILDMTEAVRDDLDAIRSDYDEEAPEGVEAVRELMVESLELFDRSFEEIGSFLADRDEQRLRRALECSEEASDILAAVDELIGVNQQFLDQFAEV